MDLDALLGLRERALMPGHPGRPLITPYDRHGEHYGVFEGDQVIACASLTKVEMPGISSARAYYLHGMAVEPTMQGSGHGRRVLEEIVSMLRTRGADLLWAKARPAALGFYRGLGFDVGDAVIVAPTGATMQYIWKRLEVAAAAERSCA